MDVWMTLAFIILVVVAASAPLGWLIAWNQWRWKNKWKGLAQEQTKSMMGALPILMMAAQAQQEALTQMDFPPDQKPN